MEGGTTILEKVVREGLKPSGKAGGMKVRGAQDHKVVMAENGIGTQAQALSTSDFYLN